MKAANPAPKHQWTTKRVAFICLLAITWFAFAAATHFHAISSSGDEGHCEFCLVLHGNSGAVPVASAPAAVPTVVLTQVLPGEECNAKSLLRDSDLYIRPPPLA